MEEKKIQYTQNAIKRIIRDIRILGKSKKDLAEQGIYFNFNDEKVGNMKALIIGTKDTPYEGGFYFFNINYPYDYPNNPPLVKFCSTDGKSRMNPNLYKNGKVCLSIINTWSGPGWLPTFTTDKVLIAIQAMVMNEYPLRNEPGFESSPKKDLILYNNYVAHQNYELCILKMLKKIPNGFSYFKDIIVNYFVENIEKYRKNLIFLSDNIKIKEIRTPCYGIQMTPNFSFIFEGLEELFDKLKFKKKKKVKI